jgi:membrane protease YdiL (CAAX protease family)
MHVLYFGVLIPALVVRQRRRMVGGPMPLPPRLTHFKSTAIHLAVFGGMSLAVARTQQIELFPTEGVHLLPGMVAGAALYAIAVALMWARWRRAVERGAMAVHFFVAESATERAWWTGVSVLAGASEEITWRGVQTALLVPLTGSPAVAALLSAVSFGVAHMTQGWRSAALIVLFGLGFQGVVWVSGSLYVAIVVHIAYDLTAGLTYGRFARELGYEPARDGT